MGNINKTGLGNSNDGNDDFNPAPLNIEDIMQLRITKVTLRKLYFDYEDRHFAIIDVSDFCNSLLYFYERIFTNDYGFVNMRFINSTDKSIRISWFIRDVSKRHPLTITYSNLDREYFANLQRLLQNLDLRPVYTKTNGQKRNRRSMISKQKLQDLMTRLRISMMNSLKHLVTVQNPTQMRQLEL